MYYRSYFFSIIFIMIFFLAIFNPISVNATDLIIQNFDTSTSINSNYSNYSINNILKIISYPKDFHIPTNAPKITVAIIDSGINKSVIPNYWVKSNTSVDDSFVNDRYGYDFVINKPVSFESSSFSDHGTFIANIISTMTKNISNINIMDIRVLDSENSNPNFNSFIEAFQYTLLFPSVRVIQFSTEFINSALSSYPQMLHWIFTKAYLRHIAIVSVSGNDGKEQISDPGNWAETIAVTSIDMLQNQWERSIYANYGSNIDISVPGTDIESLGNDGRNLVLSGTSFSAAFVGGAIALLDAMYPSRNMSIETIRGLLQSSATNLGNCDQFGAGLLNISNMIDLANGSSYMTHQALCSGAYTIPTSLEPEPTSKSLSFSKFFVPAILMLLFSKKCKIRKLKRT